MKTAIWFLIPRVAILIGFGFAHAQDNEDSHAEAIRLKKSSRFNEKSPLVYQ